MTTLSQSSVLKLYHSVIDDVIAGVRDSFLDDGVDEQVLQELRQTWETKLLSNKAVEQNPEPSDSHVIPSLGRSNIKMTQVKKSFGFGGSVSDLDGRLTDTFPQDASTLSIAQPEKLYPVQITLPAQQGSGETGTRVLTIQVPESGITGNHLQNVLTGPLIAATLALPTNLATSLLQQHVTAALRGHQTGNVITARTFNAGNGTGQVDGTCDNDDATNPQPSTSSSSSSQIKTKPKRTKLLERRRCKQVDGGIDTSDEDDDDEDDDDIDDDEEDKDEDADEAEGGAEEEPLNSEDDVSDEDVSDLFDTDNVVVCQYDKITRSRNKWKFYLKDGIMNLSGKDYVFQKSNGDAEW